ncbi:hypothetical protein FQN55_009405 [Onygenales sp. PD_40]|nr:hypothetical protein FQN55_009405 [Onygenales sp. PD_40]
MSASSTPLLDLAAQISDAAKAVHEFLVANGHPQPSFEADSQLEFPDAVAAPEIVACRRKLIEASRTINDLINYPTDHIRKLSLKYHDHSTLRWIYHHDIAKIVPLEGDISFTELAASANVDEDHARRMLRYAMTNRIFKEPRVGYVAHTASSSLLVRSEGIRSWIGFGAEEGYPTSVKMPEAMEKFRGSQSAHECAYNLAFETDLSYFQHLALFPERQKRFAVSMREATSAGGWSTSHLVSGYPWETIGESTVVDVGGSTGHTCIALAEKATSAKFIVQDLPQVVEQNKTANHLPASLKDRIEFQGHDFFNPQPFRGGDIYLLRWILHDHPDAAVLKILRNLVPALKNGARIILNDIVLPEPGILPAIEERIVRHSDLEMMNLFNSRERPLADWIQLCKDVDPRLELGLITTPPGAALSIIELIFRDGDGNGAAGAS